MWAGSRLRGALAVAVVVVMASAIGGVLAASGRPPGPARGGDLTRMAAATSTTTLRPTTIMIPRPVHASRAPAPARPTAHAAAAPSRPSGPVKPAAPMSAADTAPLPGCPPPPYHGPPPSPPWHPAVLVPDAALPPTPPPISRRAGLGPLTGKGMWIWQFSATDAGRSTQVVHDAVAAGLHQLWVRVGDSADGFYGAPVLDALVPLAHRAHLAVIGWGFPYLYDPVGDARWTDAALDWRSSQGDGLDGYSADIETAGEGVDLTARRAALYLGLVAHAHPASLLTATVFPPSDYSESFYPYAAIAPYVEALTPMVYWGCTQPTQAAELAIARLRPLAPLHLIGQAYDMAPEGGRIGPPPGSELTRFMEVAKAGGALGVSFWSWQGADQSEWDAIAGFSWRPAGP